MPATVTLRALGLNRSPNSLSIPDGSLLDASNVIIKRDNVIESRRGFMLFGDQLGTSTDRAKQLMVYTDRILRHFASTIEFQDGFNNDGSVHFTPFAGNYLETQTGLRIKSQESNRNFYFTTSDGIKKISVSDANQLSSVSGFITNAGGIKALDLTAQLDIQLGNTTGFLPEDSAVAYRVVWGTNDANNNLILGTPSQRAVIYNPLEPLIIRDYLTILKALDDIDQSGSLITDGDYLNTLKLDINASPVDLYNNLLLLTAKLDNDIVIVPEAGSQVLSSQRLTTTTAEVLVDTDITSLLLIGDIITPSNFINTDFNTRQYSITNITNQIQIAPNIPLHINVTFSQRLTTTTSEITFNRDISPLVRVGSILTPSGFTNTDFNTRTYTINTITNNTVTLAPSGGTTIIASQRLTTSTAKVLFSTDISSSIQDGYTLNFSNFNNTDFNTRQYFITDFKNTIDIIPNNNVNGNATISTSKRVTLTTAEVVFSGDITGLLTIGDILTFANFINTDFNTRTYSIDNIISGTTVQCTIASGGNHTGTDTTAIAESIYSTATITGTTVLLGISTGSPEQTGTDTTLVFETITSTAELTNTILGVTVLTGGNQTGIDITPVAETAGSAVTTTGTTLELTIVPDTVSPTTSLPQTGTDSSPITESPSSQINRYKYGFIDKPLVPTVPATDDELLSLQTYLSTILNDLQNELDAIISSSLRTTYLDPINITTSANVILNITIPQEVNSNYFFQIYRSGIAQATGTTILNDLVPNDELQLVYEAYPTAAELLARSVTVEDITPDSFRGANLYTNPSTGEGILQSNDLPPFAKDLAKFKNRLFYANTKTHQRLNFNLLGVAKMIQDYNNSIIPTLTIASGNSFSIYSFITGQKQIVDVTCNAASTLISTVNPASYFLLNSANNTDLYYIWYKNGPNPTDPMISGRIGIEVIINTTDTAVQVADQTRDSISLFVADFNVSVPSGSTVEIDNTDFGYTNDPVDGAGGQATGFIFNTSTPGRGELLQKKITNIATIADVANSLNGTYFNVQTPFDQNLYYFWIKTSTGPVIDPAPPGRIGIRVNINTNDSANAVALALSNTFNTLTGIFSATNSTNNTIVTDFDFGTSTNFFDGTSPTGFTFSIIQPGAIQVLLSTEVSPSIAVDETARSLIRIINKNINEIIYGFYLSGAGDVPGKMLFEGRELSNNPFYLIGNNDNTGNSFNQSISPEFTISNISVANPTVVTATGHNLSNGDQVVIANSNSLPSINGIYTVSNVIAGVSFTIPVDVVTMGTSGVLSKLTDIVTVSQNEAKPNRIYYSKLQQPEAVPLVNFFDVGGETKAILRIFALRDSLFVFKEDGLYRISGEDAPFNLALFDSSCICVAADSVSVSNNVIYSWTTQGISIISESGVTPSVSRPIDVDLLQLASANYPNFNTATWGVGYESDNSYLVFTITEPSDTEATICYRYSNLTNSWTTYAKTNTCGVINQLDDKLYLGAGDTNFLEQERKTFSRLDYTDRQYPSSLTTGNYINNGLILRLADVTNIEVGDVIVQEQTLTTFDFNLLLKKLDIDPGVAIAPITSITTGSVITVTTSVNHNLQNGEFVNITNSNSNPLIDGLYQVNSITPTTFQINVVNPIIITGTSGTARYSYFANLKVSGGANIRTSLENLCNKLDTDPGVNDTDYFNTISTKTGSPISNIDTTPTIITFISHGLVNNRVVGISGSNSVPAINGNFTVTVIDANKFSIPFGVVTAGTIGSFTTQDNDFNDILACYNAIITKLNNDISIAFANYPFINHTTIEEAIVTNVNIPLKQITLNPILEFIIGPLTIYKAIPTNFLYTPVTFQDPLSFKHIREATIMFESKNFTGATLSFSTDLLPGFIDVPFTSDGNGIFGNQAFGSGFFGGTGNSAPFRTYIPRQCQRCRFMNVEYKHKVAREKWSCFGITLTGEVTPSSRAYR